MCYSYYRKLLNRPIQVDEKEFMTYASVIFLLAIVHFFCGRRGDLIRINAAISGHPVIQFFLPETLNGQGGTKLTVSRGDRHEAFC